MLIGARTYAEGKRIHFSRITPRHLKFVHAFVGNGGRGAAAAIAAGFAKSSAAVTSVQILKNDRFLALIAAEIRRRQPDYMATLAAKRLLRPARPQWLRVKFQLLLNKHDSAVKVIGAPGHQATITSPADEAMRNHIARHADVFGLDGAAPGANSEKSAGNLGENDQNHRLCPAVTHQKKDLSKC